MSSSDLMGVVIFGQPAEAVSQDQVAAALAAAGMDAQLGSHLNARSWFIRATRGLAKSLPEIVLRDCCAENDDRIKFAFISRKIVADNPFYDAACEIIFDKKTALIFCDKAPTGLTRDAVEQEARELLASARTTWEPADIGALVKRFLSPVCRQLPLRPGVSFISRTYAEHAKKIQAFYEALEVPYYVLEVGYTPRLGAQVQKAIVADLRSQVQNVLDEISTLKVAGELTQKKSRSRLAELRKALVDYQELARCSRLDIDDLIDRSGEAGRVLVAASMPSDEIFGQLQSGRSQVPALIADLYAAEAEIDVGALVAPQPQALVLESPAEVARENVQPAPGKLAIDV